MFHQRKINMRHVAIYIASMLFLVVLLPYVSIKLFPSLVEHEDGIAYKGEIPKTVKVYITEKKNMRPFPLKNTSKVSPPQKCPLPLNLKR